MVQVFKIILPIRNVHIFIILIGMLLIASLQVNAQNNCPEGLAGQACRFKYRQEQLSKMYDEQLSILERVEKNLSIGTVPDKGEWLLSYSSTTPYVVWENSPYGIDNIWPLPRVEQDEVEQDEREYFPIFPKPKPTPPHLKISYDSDRKTSQSSQLPPKGELEPNIKDDDNSSFIGKIKKAIKAIIGIFRSDKSEDNPLEDLFEDVTLLEKKRIGIRIFGNKKSPDFEVKRLPLCEYLLPKLADNGILQDNPRKRLAVCKENNHFFSAYKPGRYDLSKSDTLEGGNKEVQYMEKIIADFSNYFKIDSPDLIVNIHGTGDHLEFSKDEKLPIKADILTTYQWSGNRFNELSITFEKDKEGNHIIKKNTLPYVRAYFLKLFLEKIRFVHKDGPTKVILTGEVIEPDDKSSQPNDNDSTTIGVPENRAVSVYFIKLKK